MPTTFVVLWVGGYALVLGAIIGSFLNVVIHRLPLGESLVRPGSRCPKCATPIRPWDNVPVLAWLWLGGRCRACGAPISMRYPLVEAAVGIVFAIIAVMEIAPKLLAPSRIADDELWRATASAAFHAILWASLLAGALIEADGGTVPLRLSLPALALGLTAAAFARHPLPTLVATAQAGAWAGGVGGVTAWMVDRDRRALPGRLGLFVGLGMAGGATPTTIVIATAGALAVVRRRRGVQQATLLAWTMAGATAAYAFAPPF